MPVALQTSSRAVAPASNDNGFGFFTAARREAAFDGFWAAVRQAAGAGTRLDYLAPGVLRVGACAAR